MKNLSLKVWSLLIAIALSYFVNSLSNSSVISLIVQVDLRNLPESKVVLLPTVRQAQVTLRGPSHLMEGVVQAAPVFRVPIPDEVGDRYSFRLRAGLLALPAGVEILNIEPPEMELVLDDVVEREVSVEVPRIGVLPEDFKLERIQIEPRKVKVVGPQSELEKLQTIKTNAIDVRAISGSVKQKLRLTVPGRYMKVDPEEVTTELVVKQIESERKFRKLPLVMRGGGAEDFATKLQHVSVEVSGPRAQIRKLKPSAVKPYVMLEEGESRVSFEAKIAVELPKGVTTIFVNPESVVVKKKGAKQ